MAKHTVWKKLFMSLKGVGKSGRILPSQRERLCHTISCTLQVYWLHFVLCFCFLLLCGAGPTESFLSLKGAVQDFAFPKGSGCFTPFLAYPYSIVFCFGLFLIIYLMKVCHCNILFFLIIILQSWLILCVFKLFTLFPIMLQTRKYCRLQTNNRYG